MDLWLAALLGLLGGLARACYGLLNAVGTGQQIKGGYFAITLLTALFLGIILGILFDIDYRAAALAGYVGTDILENFLPASIPQTLTIKK